MTRVKSPSVRNNNGRLIKSMIGRINAFKMPSNKDAVSNAWKLSALTPLTMLPAASTPSVVTNHLLKKPVQPEFGLAVFFSTTPSSPCFITLGPKTSAAILPPPFRPCLPNLRDPLFDSGSRDRKIKKESFCLRKNLEFADLVLGQKFLNLGGKVLAAFPRELPAGRFG